MIKFEYSEKQTMMEIQFSGEAPEGITTDKRGYSSTRGWCFFGCGPLVPRDLKAKHTEYKCPLNFHGVQSGRKCRHCGAKLRRDKQSNELGCKNWRAHREDILRLTLKIERTPKRNIKRRYGFIIKTAE